MSENKSIGGLWKKEKNGHEYLSGQIEIDGVKHNFVCFKNSFKKDGDNKPDYYIPAPREEQQPQGTVGNYEDVPTKTEEDLPF